jgi:hypothetical protein
MSIPQTRPFANTSYPTSPSPTTASSLNYSQYGSGSFVSPNRGIQPNPNSNQSSSFSGSGHGPGPGPGPGARVMAQGQGQVQRPGGGGGSGGLRPPGNGLGTDGRKLESKEIARIHWKALREFLASWLEKGRLSRILPKRTDAGGQNHHRLEHQLGRN